MSTVSTPTVKIDADLYQRLKFDLEKKGETFSGWVRKMVEKRVRRNTKKINAEKELKYLLDNYGFTSKKSIKPEEIDDIVYGK